MKIGIIGIGGRTGTMLAFQLKNLGEVFGIGREEELKKIREKKLFLKINNSKQVFECNLIKEDDFPQGIDFDLLFLTVKNPVREAIRYYFQKIKERNFKIPVLFLSQNGIEAGEEAIKILKEILKEKEVPPIFRFLIFNTVEKEKIGENFFIKYSIPIKIALAKISGFGEEKEIIDFLKNGGFQIDYFLPKEAKNMEYSKLFLNLIGMASASRGFSLVEGFAKKEVFREEILALREYIKLIKKNKGKLLNFKYYPVKSFSRILKLPILFLFLFRNFLAKIIEKKRSGKLKDLEEIDYYNGAVVKLGKKIGVDTPVNETILKRIMAKK